MNMNIQGKHPRLDLPWSRRAEDVLKSLNVEEEGGLSPQRVKEARSRYGKNWLRETRVRSAWAILAAQFKSVIMILLSVAAGLSFAFSQWIDGIAIVVAMFINAAIGFFTELQAVRSMESLQSMDRVTARVRRDGRPAEISAEEIVPGDIIIVESGNLITADVRITEASKLQVNESPLTGESLPVDKQVEPVAADAILAERASMLYKGTAVSRGSGEGVVVATGMDTEIGTIASLVQEAREEEDPLEKRLNRLGKKLVWIVIAIAAVVAAAGILAGRELFLMIETAIALAVAAIPEGLPIVATVALARGMQRMAKRNALVRRLSAVQTLGSTSVIFSDKTGTLTENQMTVTRILLPEGEVRITGTGIDLHGEIRQNEGKIDPSLDQALEGLFQVSVLCNNASLNMRNEEQFGIHGEDETVGDPEVSPIGDPLEIALLVAAAKAGVWKDEVGSAKPEVREVSFDPDVKMMATVHESDGVYEFAVKGAPEAVLSVCTSIGSRENEKKLTEEERSRWLCSNREMAAQGQRMLAAAWKRSRSLREDPYRDLTFIGLISLQDPPRKGIKTSVNDCMKAGIRVIMVTGDQEPTALHVGREIGLIDEGADTRTLPGKGLKEPDELSREERERILKTSIFTRVSPEQKLNLISIHQESGSIVAMTGDGVNDAPALKKANIGVAMGKRGQQVAKEAADVILRDDAFSSILVAVRYGRTIFENIRKFVLYLLSGNVGEILIVAFASLIGAPLPLLPLQILFLNAINDAFPALALGMGEGDSRIMERQPHPSHEPIMTRNHWISIGVYGAIIALAVLAAFFIALNVLGLDKTGAVTVSFLTIALSRLWHVFNMREDDSGILKNQVTRNRYVWGALALCTALILSGVYVPQVAHILEVKPPDLRIWTLILGFSFIPAFLGQIWKFIFQKVSRMGKV